MNKQHDWWLQWKMDHGLASRGRVTGIMNPKGLIAGLLYKFYFKKFEQKMPPNTVFHQDVGGTLSGKGDVE